MTNEDQIPEWMRRFLSLPFCFDCAYGLDIDEHHPCHRDEVCHQYAAVRPELPYMEVAWP